MADRLDSGTTKLFIPPMSGGRAAPRERSLDALRGIAAFVVMTYHMNLAYHGVNLASSMMIPVRPLFGGSAAVYIFFVMSGFVLFRSLEGKDGFRYGPYIVKRMLRLYLPLAAAVLISALFYWLVKPVPIVGGSTWLNQKSWEAPPSLGLLLGHLALLDTTLFQSLDNVIWSLVHEIRISVIFPLLAVCIVRWPRQTLVLSLILSACGFYFAPDKTPPQAVDLLRTARYVFLFVAGAWMASRSEQIRSLMNDSRLAWGGIAVAWGLLALGSAFAPLAYSAASILLVAIVSGNARISRGIERRVFIWLGEVSYGLYLIHLPLLLVFAHMLNGLASPAVVIGLAIPSALLGAQLFTMFVDRKAIRIGRWASARLFYREPALAS